MYRYKWLLQLTIIVAIAMFTLLSFAEHAEARSYSFPELNIEAEILEDGSMLVTEERTANFNGSFYGLYQWIYTQPGEEIVDIIVLENGQPYEFNPGTEFGPPGTYLVDSQPESVYIDWSFEATDEQRTFTLQYRVLNVVRVHEDVAELYYQFIGDDWEVGVEQVEINLKLPEGAQENDIRAWGHGPLHGNVTINNTQLVTWDIDRLSARASLTGRVTFPVELVPAATNKTGELALPLILEQEQKWADEANKRREQARVNWILVPIIFITGLVYSIIMWSRHGKAYKASFEGDYYRELPGAYTPAELGCLWRFDNVRAEDFTATIMDLARRGYFSIEETTRDVKGLFRTTEAIDYKLTLHPSKSIKDTDLLDHEQRVLQLLFEDVATDNKTVTFHELETYSEKHDKAFMKFWDAWKKKVQKQARSHRFFEAPSSGNVGKHAIAGVVGFILGIIIMIWQIAIDGQFIAASIALIIASVIYIISLIFHQRRSREGQEQYVKWQAFRRFLQHFSNMDRHDIPSLVVWEHYLVYAIPLGVAKKVIEQLQLVYPNLQQDNYRFGHGWYYYNVHAMNQASLGNNIDNMTTTISQSVQKSISTATSQTSSGSGGGGGFSGGGGGGFSGGGGGGAR
ncbi:DUF2207 domain-containing protein [Desulfuribacillus alkaliarsenatis]|uniref:DUF2207 domain-containing protein n=1 Tax=Desulfuribacillus alkaliarsenatis TaxID=766136 RepID=A0A1E5G131_9FIRM|nr:DUF2207 domain-containing protein [Desulfuribacillus alkaliarsenatis]OEF96603.1 hypothetical protein BHF68_08135 [Desulfuribacillus alkaliarsenatis]